MKDSKKILKLAEIHWDALGRTQVPSARGALFSLHTQNLLEAIALEPGNAGFHYQFADSCYWAGLLTPDPKARNRNRAEALRSFRRARSLYPANPHYSARIAILLAKSASTPAEKALAQTEARDTLDLDARSTGLLQRLKLTAAEQRACEAIATGVTFEKKAPGAAPRAGKPPAGKPPAK